MTYSIETIAGTQYIVIRNGNTIHQIPLQALSTWGALLGHTDPGDTLEAILQYEEPENGENIWGGLYDAVIEGLDEMSQAGVPPQFADELLQDATAPLPTSKARAKLDKVRFDSEKAIKASSPKRANNSVIETLKAELSADYIGEIQEGRINFIDDIQPVYEVLPPAGQAY